MTIVVIIIVVVVVVLLLLMTLSHFSASICWETFTYPRLSEALG